MALRLRTNLIAGLVLFAALSIGRSQTYSTSFAANEGTLSGNGHWSNNGIDWATIRTANGIAYGTQTGTNTGIYQYNDSYAHLSGFSADQEAWGKAYIGKPDESCSQELEILLRWNSSPHRTTGYECFARCVDSAASYVQIVRWEGPLGKFTYLADNRGTNYGLKNGDILKASVVGNVITVFINGVQKAQAIDNTYDSGNPGIGEFLACHGGHGVGSNTNFGFASFFARNLSSNPTQSTTAAIPNTHSLALESFSVSDLDRVFEDGYGYPWSRQDSIQLFGLRNEIISGQAVLSAHEDLPNLTVNLSALRHTDGTSVIPQQNLHWNFVESISIEKNSPNRQKQTLLRTAPASFPDFLSDFQTCSISNGSYKAIYVTAQIPADATPGEYRGTLSAKAGSASADLPIEIQVYPLTLPNDRHLMLTEWFSTGQFSKHHHLAAGDTEGFYRLLRLYAQNMVNHRQNVFRLDLGSIGSTRTADGRLQFDFTEFDQMAQVFWDTGHMDLLETGFVAQFGKQGWSGSKILLDHFSVTEPNGKRASLSGEEFLPQFLPAFVAHLRAKRWLEKTVFHICDEPSNHNVSDWRTASDIVHRYAPELRRIDAIETPHCLDALEIWVPKLDHLATWWQSYEQAQRHGNELWYYTVGIYQGGSFLNKTVDVPLIESRLMHWLNFRYNLAGYLHWGFNAWTDDPIHAPGEHRGDGWLVYPGKDGLLDSIRWEQTRNGLQDFECLWLLQDKIAGLRARLPSRISALIDPRQRPLEIASQVVPDYYAHALNPTALYQARRAAIEETLALDQSPKVLLLTTPREHSGIAKGCAVDLHGWAEPGTTLSANGQNIPVANDGLFLAMVEPSPEVKIVVQAKSNGERKELIRYFAIKPSTELDSPPASASSSQGP